MNCNVYLKSTLFPNLIPSANTFQWNLPLQGTFVTWDDTQLVINVKAGSFTVAHDIHIPMENILYWTVDNDTAK